ncbi:hypothetical protein QUB80_04155 [Chlorogloeopsis sp. ULAP01]|uniref:hypothetical protein n=1 Tax=Chlorogloeopsis sp. ULAP01 TaxID=3056483 RepID=UPI0025AA3EC8|nr:hypothetical protein [Chlorogloeopsis sp. ULAP01]MDM9379891.1 hypothetical protein [Chlorogloeopsis sp. ULAP01]
MLKKSLAFGLLAAGMMIAPGAAMAQQLNVQEVQQEGAAFGGSQVINNAELKNNQQLIKLKDGRYCYSNPGGQASVQRVGQFGQAAFDSTVVNNAELRSRQQTVDIANCTY